MKKCYIIIVILISAVIGWQMPVMAQVNSNSTSEKFELTGQMSFDISSRSGIVRSVAITIGDGGTGPYKAIMAGDTTLLTHTIFRPNDLSPFTGKNKLPIVVFGNGGCRNSSGEFRNFLSEVASHGFLVIAVGPVNNTMSSGSEGATNVTNAKSLLDAIDWAISENNRPGSVYFQKIETTKIAVMGQSCGGMQALEVSSDPRISTTVVLNSGVFEAIPDSMSRRENFPKVTKSDLSKIHGPVAYYTGGERDALTVNAADDFKKINQVPVLFATYDFTDKARAGYGHYPATYRKPNGGDFAIAAVAWLKWQLKGDEEAADMFIGDPCGLTENSKWTVKKKNID
jgi:dienelactone hydrolase